MSNRGLVLMALIAAMSLASPLRGAGASEALVWESFARSSAAYYLFNATAEGREIFEAVTALPARRARELSLLAEALAKPAWRGTVKPELDARLVRLDERFRAARGTSELLSAADERLLAQMAREELAGLRLTPARPTEFVQGQAEFLGERFAAGLAANDSGPASFLQSLWHDGLAPELAALPSEWPGQVRYHASAPWGAGRRAVLIVSTAGLASDAAERLVAQVTRTLAPSTVSFPAAERGGRLLVRFGADLYDFRGQMVSRPFSPPTRTTVDPVAVLSFPERARLARYIAQHPLMGSLESERWIGEPLREMFGMEGGLRDFVTSPASAERVPLMIVWTPESAAAVEGRYLIP